MVVPLFKACVSYFVIYFPSFVYVIHSKSDKEISQYILWASGFRHNVELCVVNIYSKEKAANIFTSILQVDAVGFSRNAGN